LLDKGLQPTLKRERGAATYDDLHRVIMETIRLDSLIFRHYSKSALFPILFIEVMLLVLYFAINSYTNKKTESSMRKEVQSVMPHLARQQAQAINANFHLINRQTAWFARTNADLLAHPELYNIPGEQPRFALSPDNALYQTNLADGSSLFYTRGNTLSAAQREKALRTASSV
jgi:hypothetical protein